MPPADEAGPPHTHRRVRSRARRRTVQQKSPFTGCADGLLFLAKRDRVGRDHGGLAHPRIASSPRWPVVNLRGRLGSLS